MTDVKDKVRSLQPEQPAAEDEVVVGNPAGAGDEVVVDNLGNQPDVAPIAAVQLPPRGAPAPPKDLEAEREWMSFVHFSLAEQSESAKQWKEGLASIVTTAAAGLLLIGIPDATLLEGQTRDIVVFLAVLATIAGLVAAWMALDATAGTPVTISQQEFERDYRTLDGFRQRRAERRARRMGTVRVAVIVSICATVIAACILWYNPPAGPYLKVQLADSAPCGKVKSADGGILHLQVKGEAVPQQIPLGKVLNMWVVSSCDG